MFPAVAAAATLFSFFFGGCSSRKTESQPVPDQGPTQTPRDHYVSPRLDPMEKYQGGFRTGSRF